MKLGIGHLRDVLLRILILLILMGLLHNPGDIGEQCPGDNALLLGATMEADIPSELDIAHGGGSSYCLRQYSSELYHSLILIRHWKCCAYGKCGP